MGVIKRCFVVKNAEKTAKSKIIGLCEKIFAKAFLFSAEYAILN